MIKITKNTEIVAFLIAPLSSALIGMARTDFLSGFSVITFFGWLLIFYFFSSVATLLFGMPLFLIFKKFDLVRWWAMTAAGILVGILAARIFSMPGNMQLEGVLTMAAMGASSAFSFWLVLMWGREDKNE